METWPQAVRLEIAQMNLIDAKVVVPMPVLERGLRLGKVEFPWKLVRAWIRPEVPPQASANDAVALPFPLTLVAPLFVAQRKPAARPQRRVAVDANIPNLFFGFPQGDGAPGIGNAAPVSAPLAAKPPDTNFYAARDYEQERSPAEPPAMGTAPRTDFLRRHSTPNELVARAVALDGVAGALVALPDGLPVASRVPPNLNGETLAAFLPQIFCKLSQCTQELRMGSLNNVNFTVGNVPWKIFRVNNVFFAAFGRAEEALPTAQLAALAAELDRKPKAD
jgi:predicted regulator of Ras-like GTPase activity (Roadblock/LC7/MglB family)